MASVLALSSWFTRTVPLVDRPTRKTTAVIRGLKARCDAIPLEDGSVLVTEIATSSITRASARYAYSTWMSALRTSSPYCTTSAAMVLANCPGVSPIGRVPWPLRRSAMSGARRTAATSSRR